MGRRVSIWLDDGRQRGLWRIANYVVVLTLVAALPVLVARAYAADQSHRGTVWTRGDDHEYQILAINLLHGHGYSATIVMPIERYNLDLLTPFGQQLAAVYARDGVAMVASDFYRAPGFPALLSAVYAAFGNSTLAARLLLAILVWLTGLLLVLTGVAIKARAGVAAGAVAMAYYLIINRGTLGRLVTEIPTTFWLVLFALVYMVYIKRGNPLLLAGAAGALAAAVLTRSTLAPALPILLVLEYLRHRQLRRPALMAAAVLLPMALWAWYATSASGRFIAFSTQGEIAFPQYNNPDVLFGVGSDKHWQGAWNPGWVQDEQGGWYTDYRFAAQPGENGWIKGLTFWRDNLTYLPQLFYVKLRAGLGYDSGHNLLAGVFLGCIGLLMAAIGFRPPRRPARLLLALGSKQIVVLQTILCSLLFVGLTPFPLVLFVFWPAILLLALLRPYGDWVGFTGPNPSWFLSFVASHGVVTLIFGGEPRFHEPLDPILLVFGLTTLFVLIGRIWADLQAIRPVPVAGIEPGSLNAAD